MSRHAIRFAGLKEFLTCQICQRRVTILIYGACARCTAKMDAAEEKEDNDDIRNAFNDDDIDE